MMENKAMERLAELIKESFDKIQTKDVKVIVEMDPDELAYKTTVGVQAAVEARIPMTNAACVIGHQVSASLEDATKDSIEVRNLRRFKVGYHLLHVMAKAMIIDISKNRTKTDKEERRAKYYVKPRDESFLADLFRDMDENVKEVQVYTKPVFEEPSPFTEFNNDVGGELVRYAHKSVPARVTLHRTPKVYTAINKHMRNEYQINTDLLSIFEQCQEDEIFTMKTKKLDKEQRDGIERETKGTMRLAKMVGDRPFWEYAFYDTRGRLYSSTVYLNHSGSKLAKSLYLFNGRSGQKKSILREGLFWMFVHAANCYGYDKASIDDRHDFTEDRLDEWMEIASNPLANKLWQSDAVDDSFGFLAAIMEIYKAYQCEDPFTYESGLMVAWDASCSGLQVLSAMARDEVSGALCNLTESDVRGDYYQMIASHVLEECVYTDQEYKIYLEITSQLVPLEQAVTAAFAMEKGTEGKSEAIKAALDGRSEFYRNHKENILASSKVFWGRPEMVPRMRKICKTPCMTYFYSCSSETMHKAMFKDMSTDKENEGLTSYYTFWLCKKIYSACRNLMPTPTALMDLFIKMGIDDYKKDRNFSLTAPLTKFPFVQNYRADVTKQVKVRYKRSEIRPVVSVGKGKKLDFQKIKSATSPNIVHMIDSQVVAGILIMADEEDYDVSCIHDSFATCPADAGILYEDIRTVFVELFEEDMLLKMLKEKNCEHYNEEIKRGVLDLEEVFDNEHNFS